MFKFNDLKIQQKLMAAFAIVIIAIAVMGVTVFVQINKLEEARFDRVRASMIQREAESAMAHLARQESSFRAFLLTSDEFYLRSLNQSLEAFDKGLERIADLDSANAHQIEAAKQAGDAWAAKALSSARSAKAEGTALSAEGLTEGSRTASIDAVEAQLQTLVDAKAAESRVYGERQDELAQEARFVLLIGSLIALVIVIGVGVLLTQTLAKPLMTMNAAMRRLSGGDTSVMVTGTHRKDEIGVMATAVQGFKDAALANLRLEEQAEAERAAARAETQRMEALAAKETEDSRMAITALGQGLSVLASGDLTYRLDQEFPLKSRRLKDDFNAAISKLDEVMGEVAQNVIAIRAGATEISQASDDLSNRTEQQAAALEETAAALDQITVTVRRTAEGARQAANVVQSARGDAEQSGQVVQDAVTAMSAIEESSTKIGNIIGVIDEIAFQTNLLALNAGVEAARAGEAGRGFAVVASEVRALAQRSADAAKEIKTLISASGRQVGSGVNLVGQTGEALQRIVSRVADIDSLVTEIAASAQEQATGLHQVNSAVNQMDQVTQQNAAMVEEATAASHSMADEADHLANSLQRFTIGQTPFAAQTASRRPSRPQARVAKPMASKPEAFAAPALAQQASPAPAPRAPIVPEPQEAPVVRAAKPVAETLAALKTVGRGGAALKPQAIEDGWEEF